ncbi:enoyl-CoA hydratase-related protein [Microbacterium pseudoresistens]|uniref:Enoyl-CoA hydratase n=1 Tax=Microbacterium pseudoresistens TaxID=640634 RepID=A0A7Y9EVT0_9MICO|nr:enoyl-CoA hydratase-related protein [Microbacterium pseudoresistens]NYD54883.1 enoyl-CoA hydratase [Microbacterium pseudoresistens]
MNATSADDPVRVALDSNGVLRVDLNRPEARNAMNRAVIDRLLDVADRAERDPSVRVILLRGEGAGFCAGHDLREHDESSPAEHLNRELRDRLNVRWSDVPVPTIVAMHGFALGSGLMLALACDLRIAAEGLEVSLPESRIGMFPALGGTTLLTRIIGPTRASLMVLTGARYDAATAAEWGLVTQVVPKDEVAATAEQLADVLAENAPLSMRFAKKVIRDAENLDLMTAHRQESMLNTIIRTSEDRREGIAAFREKRKPRFRGA